MSCNLFRDLWGVSKITSHSQKGVICMDFFPFIRLHISTARFD